MRAVEKRAAEVLGVRGSALRGRHHGAGRRRHLPVADRGRPGRRDDVRQVPRGQRDQCRDCGRASGRRSAIVTRTGDDPSAGSSHQALEGFGVDDRFVSSVPHLATPVVFCEIFPPDDFPLYFYREPKAPDMEMTSGRARSRRPGYCRRALGDCDRIVGRAEPRSHAHGAAYTQSPASDDPRSRLPTVFWDSREQAREQVSAALDLVTVAVGNLDECETAVGTRDPDRAADALLERGLDVAIVKQGPKGVLGRTATADVRDPRWLSRS